MSLQVKVARSRNAGRGMPGTGDPGLFGAIGSIIGKVAGVVSKIPGPIGLGASVVSRLVRRPQPMVGQLPQPWETPFQLPQVPKPTLRGAVERFLPGGETGMMAAPAVGAPSGYHVNKTAYYLKDGTYVPEESRWVKNRRTNPLNPRAASKALRRLGSLKRAMEKFKGLRMPDKCCK